MSHQEGVGAGNDVVYSKQPSNVMVNFLEDTCGSAGASFTYKGQSGAVYTQGADANVIASYTKK